MSQQRSETTKRAGKDDSVTCNLVLFYVSYMESEVEIVPVVSESGNDYFRSY